MSFKHLNPLYNALFREIVAYGKFYMKQDKKSQKKRRLIARRSNHK